MSDAPRTLRPCRVSIDNLLGPYAAYTTGERWNGWARPYFTKAVADTIVHDWNALNTTHSPARSPAAYWWYPDKFHFFMVDSNEWDDFTGEILTLSGTPTMLFPIGNGCWTWEEEETPNPTYHEPTFRTYAPEWGSGPNGTRVLMLLSEELIDGRWEPFVSILKTRPGKE